MLKLVVGFVILGAIQTIFLGGLAAISPAIVVPAILLLFLFLPESAPRR